MTQLKALFVLLLMCFVAANSQLTFSPAWGKRDPAAALGGGGGAGASSTAQFAGNSWGQESNCKTSMDSMLLIYRLIQTEAQRIVTCSGGGK